MFHLQQHSLAPLQALLTAQGNKVEGLEIQNLKEKFSTESKVLREGLP